MKPFFTEEDFPGFEKPMSLEHRLDCALRANEKVAPLLERLKRYEIVEKAALETNERLRAAYDNAELRWNGRHHVVANLLREALKVMSRPQRPPKDLLRRIDAALGDKE